MQNEKVMADHLKRLLPFVHISSYKYKVHGILDIITSCLSKICSQEIIAELVTLLLQLKESVLIRHICAITLQVSDPNLIQKCLKKFQNCYDLLLNKDESSQWCLDVLPLLFRLPSNSSEELIKYISPIISKDDEDSETKFVAVNKNGI
jgi:hypothetical protein